MIDLKELRKTFGDPDFSCDYKSLVVELLDALEATKEELSISNGECNAYREGVERAALALEAADKELEEIRIKVRQGGELGLGPYTLVPNGVYRDLLTGLEDRKRAVVAWGTLAESQQEALQAADSVLLCWDEGRLGIAELFDKYRAARGEK